MKFPGRLCPRASLRLFWRTAFAIGALPLAFTSAGCLSTKYKKAPKDTPPPLALNFTAEQAGAAVTLHTVIVQKGPGSWRKEAYWDEYVCSIANRSTAPLAIESVALVDVLDAEQAPGDEPWALEKRSRENLKKFEHSGRKIVVGTGLVLSWAAAPGAMVAALASNSAFVGITALGTFVGIPVWAAGTGVRTLIARSAVTREFNERRLALPTLLAPGETRHGSFFFPVSPGPQRLIVRNATGGTRQEAVLDLAPLAGLHLLKQIVPDAGSNP